MNNTAAPQKTQVLDRIATDTLPSGMIAASQPGAADIVHVLHVEDNPADALLMQEYIRGVLPTVTFDTVTRMGEVTAERAVAADCALLDLSLPDASGLEGLAALRELSEDLPIIVLTGFDDLALGLTAVRDGADDYLLKSHVDGYTLERAVQYSIERRRLMLQLAKSSADTVIATASTIAADAAVDAMLRLVQEGERMQGSGTAAPYKAALGTHEVSVRIDKETGEYALNCQSCDWEAERGPDHFHSWASRSLDVLLLGHIDFSGRGHDTARAVSAAINSSVPRRMMLSPRTWMKPAANQASDGV